MIKLFTVTLASLLSYVFAASSTITNDIVTIYGTIPDYTKACTVDMDCHEADSYCCSFSDSIGSESEGYACGRYSKNYISVAEGSTWSGGKWF